MADRRSVCAIQFDGWPLIINGAGEGAGSSLCNAPRKATALERKDQIAPGGLREPVEAAGAGECSWRVRSFSGATATGMARVAWGSFYN
jgi:hypothetical protein